MEHWKRNLTATWISQLLCILGFSSVFSFLPFYIQDLGVTDPDQVKLWTGWVSTGGSLSMAIMAPIWGSLADRYGRKIMVERAAFAGALLLMLMAFAANAQQLLALRTIQGAFTGTVSAFVTLVASTTPKGKEGFSLGLMQVAVYSGLTGGPLIGGFIADSLGYRATFIASALMLIIGGLVAWRFIEERFVPRESRKRQSIRSNAKEMFTNKIVLTMTALTLALYFTASMVRPIMPLFIQELQPSQARLATTTGLIQGANALAAALAAALAGRISDRIGHRRVLVMAALFAAALYFPMAFVQSTMQFLVLNTAVGLFLGGLLPSTNALIALNVEQESQGATYGLMASAGAAGRALAPMIGSVAAVSLGFRALFPIAATLYVIIAIWVGLAIPRARTPSLTNAD